MVMPTREQITELEGAAQAILHLQPFDEVRPKIEAVAEAAGDEWGEARLRKLPIGAAFAHLIGTRAIAKVQTHTTPEVSASLDPYEQYLAMTEALDDAAGSEIVQEPWPPTFQAAFEYFSKQLDALLVFEQTHPEIVIRRGKIPNTQVDPRQLLVDQITGNTKGNTMAHVVREALRICLREQAVPEPTALSTELISNIHVHTKHSALPGELFNDLLLGRALARDKHRAMQTEQPLDTPKWNEILRQQVEQHSLHPNAHNMAQPLQQPLEAEAARIAAVRGLGHCGAQLYLRPYERPHEPGVNAKHTTGFFASYGIPLTDGAFRLIYYQLLRGITAAEATIFADPEYRAGLLALAGAVRGD
jgi:hypothetical protein